MTVTSIDRRSGERIFSTDAGVYYYARDIGYGAVSLSRGYEGVVLCQWNARDGGQANSKLTAMEWGRIEQEAETMIASGNFPGTIIEL